ncbi:hypothetical protein HDU77_011004, partial [Chytriomyces hyalinus]
DEIDSDTVFAANESLLTRNSADSGPFTLDTVAMEIVTLAAQKRKNDEGTSDVQKRTRAAQNAPSPSPPPNQMPVPQSNAPARVPPISSLPSIPGFPGVPIARAPVLPSSKPAEKPKEREAPVPKAPPKGKGTFSLQIPGDTRDPLVIAESVLADVKISMSLRDAIAISTPIRKVLHTRSGLQRVYENETVPSTVNYCLTDDDQACINAAIITDPPADVSQLPTTLVNLFLGNVEKIKESPSYAGFMKSKDTVYDKMFARTKNAQTLYAMDETFLATGFSITTNTQIGGDPATTFSTYPAPRLRNVAFQEKVVVPYVPLDCGAEANFCQFELMSQTSDVNALARQIVLTMIVADGGKLNMYGLIRAASVKAGGISVPSHVWVYPPQAPGGKEAVFSLLLGMPFMFSSRCKTSWDSAGNLWAKLTSPEDDRSIQMQVTSIHDPKAVTDFKYQPPQESTPPDF